MFFDKMKSLCKMLSILLIIGIGIVRVSNAQRVMSLDEALELALESNSDLKIREIEEKISDLKSQEVLTNFFPKISAQAMYLSVKDPIRLLDWDYKLGSLANYVPSGLKGITDIHLDDTMIGNITAVQPIFMGGKIIYGYKMANAGKRLSVAMSETEKSKVKIDIIDTYWQLVSLSSKERLLNKLNSLLSDAQHNVDIAIKNGVATRADGLAIRVKKSEAELQLAKVKDGIALLEMLLAEKLGLAQEERVIPKDISELENILPIDTAEGVVFEIKTDFEKSLSKRSEIKSLNIIDTVFQNKERMILADLMPKVVGMASFSTLSPNPFAEPRTKFGNTWAVGIGLQMPISGIWETIIKYKEAGAERQVYKEKRHSSEKKIKLQMQQQLYATIQAEKQLQTATKALMNAEENLRYANIGYKEGVIALLNLTTAQTAWSQAHDAYIDAWINKKLQESKSKEIIP